LYNRFSIEGRINQLTTAVKTEVQQIKNSRGQYLLNKAIEADPIAGGFKRTKDAVETVKRVGSGIAHGNTDAGRVWYEGDINYASGYRGNERLLYSNDGLMYRTTDHYKTVTQIK
jgi:hypothetical protein